LTEIKQVQLKTIELAKLSFWNDRIITDALYNVTCFNKSGKVIWKKFQMNRTEVTGGKIYFSDNYRETKIRVGEIDVRTGRERILYSEPIQAP
jgi:hypothetical protein